MSANPNETLRVTLEDLSEISAAPAHANSALAATSSATIPVGAKSYGNINAMPDAPALTHEKASIFLEGWCYLGLAGLTGALAAWAICEPGFVDGEARWGNIWMLPLLVAMMCLGFAVAESLVERSLRKALIRGGLALPLGIILGFVFNGIANIFYAVGKSICFQAGVQSFHNPSLWIARGLAWAVFGVAGGVVYGIIGQSMKKTGYGALGGALGALIGGIAFDPISFLAHDHAAPSRAIGFGLLGMTTGVAMGLVESALKDRWLYVTAGPLAGKQFILYKSQTAMGSSQACDIYLFKDPDILPQHAVLEIKGSRVHLIANGPAYVAGQPVRGMRVLESGTAIQLGRYGFRYQEKQR